MSTQRHANGTDEDDNDLVTLNLDRAPDDRSLLGPEGMLEQLKRCGNARTSNPLPWAQLSVVMLVSLSEGSCELCFQSLPVSLPQSLYPLF